MDTMKKTVFEEMKITYHEENGYLIPNLAMPKQTDYPIGKYGQLRLDFIKKHRQGTYMESSECWISFPRLALVRWILTVI